MCNRNTLQLLVSAQSSIRGILSEGFFVHMIGGILKMFKSCRGCYVHPVKNMRGVASTYAKMSRGCFVRGVFCPDTRYPAQQRRLSYQIPDRSLEDYRYVLQLRLLSLSQYFDSQVGREIPVAGIPSDNYR